MADECALRLSDFPVEILSTIFSMTDSVDKVSLSKVCQRFDNILQRRELNGSVDLQRSYQLPISDITYFLKDKTRCSHITSVNLTSCYWIPSAIIRKCLIKLKNLETVLAADTKLSSSDLKTLLISLPKVTNVAFSWSGPIDIGCRAAKLHSIYIYVPCLNWDPSLEILNLLKLCRHIENISIVGSTIFHSPENYLWLRYEKFELPKLQSLFITLEEGLDPVFHTPLVNGSIRDFNKHMLANLLTTATGDDFCWDSYWLPNRIPVSSQQDTIVYLKRRPVFWRDKSSSLIDRTFHARNLRVDERPLDSPFLSRLSKIRSLSAYCGSDEIPFLLVSESRLEELNLYGSHDKKVLSLCQKISGSFSSYRLRKLCLPATVIWREKSEGNSSVSPFQGFGKRPRISHMKQVESTVKSPFQNLVFSCPNMEVFVLDNQERKFLISELPDNFEWDSEQLIHIASWKKLKKLTLGGIPVSSFYFLDKIGHDCPLITSLSLNYLHLTAAAVNMSGLIRALPLFKKLDDFAIRQPAGVSVLPGLTHKTLRRVVMLCSKVPPSAFEEFLTVCDKVIFFYVKCDIPKTEIQRIKTRVQNRFSHRQALVFHIVSTGGRHVIEDIADLEAKSVPGIHANEMLSRWMQVGGPHPGDNYIYCE